MSKKVIAITSIAGSVGKTVIAAHILSPRMPTARFLTADRANITAAHFGINTEAFSGSEFNKLFSEIMDDTENDIIIDVGGSKEGVEFISGMHKTRGQSEITDFIVPTMPEFKDQDGAMKTIELLLNQNVPASKIKVVFMKYTRSVDDEFDHVLRGMAHHNISIDLRASVEDTPLFDILSSHGVSMATIISDKTDYKAKMLTFEKGTAERDQCIDMRIAQGSAVEVNENLEVVFNSLFPSKKIGQ